MTRRLLLLVLFLICLPALAADWPQYRGPNRDDVSAETGLLKQWPEAGPSLLWTYTDAGVGYSGPAIVGDRLYTMGGRGDNEMLIALDLKTIKDNSVPEAWSVRVGPTFTFASNKWSAGPSSTPTVDGELVYALGGEGDLVCVETATGKERWRKNLPKNLASEVNPIGGGPKKLGWGHTWSPFVDGPHLICAPGGPQGLLAALDKKTGAVIWRSKGVTDQTSYSSPMPLEVQGVKQYVQLTNKGLVGVAAKDGQLLWRYDKQYGTEVVNTPLIRAPHVYATVGGAAGCDLIEVKTDGKSFTVEKVYNNRNVSNHHGNLVLFGDHVYGYGDGQGWVCQEFKSGKNLWAERTKLRAGSVTCADGHLYLYSEDNGTVALIEASPAGWKEKGRFKIPQQTTLRKPQGRIWTPPVVANGKLFLRDQDLIFCYDVKEKK